MYIVKHYFTDLQDKNHAYEPGDVYPREGLEPSPERIKELSSDKNLQHKKLIEEKKTETKKQTKASSEKKKTLKAEPKE